MSLPTPPARPDWLNDELFPFQSNYLEIDGNVVHYVDEGSGPTILMYHGNPTWSFLYRTVITGLKDRFRCIAFDYPGFGLSTPALGYEFTYREHLEVAGRFVDTLGLMDITSFVQDWGEPIGLGVAVNQPDNHRALVIGNTFAWPADQLSWRLMSAALGGPIGRLVVDRGNFLARSVASSHELRKLSADESQHYTSPFPTSKERQHTRQFISQIRGARSDLEHLTGGLSSIKDLPTLFFWGDQDSFYRKKDLARLQRLFPTHSTHLLAGAGHFIQSEAGDAIAIAISEWFPA